MEAPEIESRYNATDFVLQYIIFLTNKVLYGNGLSLEFVLFIAIGMLCSTPWPWDIPV